MRSLSTALWKWLMKPTVGFRTHTASMVVTAFLFGFTTAWADLAVTINAATEVPVTAASYSASGTISFTLGFTPTPGTNLTVIKNTGLPFITGQFSNLANGATVNLSYAGAIYPFVAWYYGGEGNNDLMLLWPYTGLAAWGRNYEGQLGNNSTTHSPVPLGVEQTGVLRGKTIVQVARGGLHNLALCSDGTLAAWGHNGHCQLGDNSTTNRQVPVLVNVVDGTSALAGKSVVAIAAGQFHSLALCSDGTVAAWGRNQEGQLGDNRAYPSKLTVAVNIAAGISALAGKSVIALAAGKDHSLALCSDGTVAAWGSNVLGQLGNDSMPFFSLVPVEVNALAGTSALAGKKVVAISAGHYHNLALCSDGTVATWGWNYYGQLGINQTTLTRQAPVAVNAVAGISALAGKSVVAIVAGSMHNLALCSDGFLAAWGSNMYGQLGDNSMDDRYVPVAVNTATGTSALTNKVLAGIAAGCDYSMALCREGLVAVWGTNHYGQLGDNSLTQRNVPVMANTESRRSSLSSKRVSGLALGGLADHSVSIYGLETPPAPKITVTGNQVEITNNDTTPSSTDFTCFGNVPVPHSQGHVFIITNLGNVPFKLNEMPNVILSGAQSYAFEVAQSPTYDVLAGCSTRFVITFNPKLPGLHMATVTIQSNALNHPSFSFNISGFGALGMKRAQSITFAPPTTVYLGQSPLGFSAYSSSGLPVTLSVMTASTTAAGAAILGNSLQFTGTGSIRLQAVQAGDGIYADAPTVVRTITVKAAPTALTLLDLAQTYTGTPRTIRTLGGTGEVTILYKVGESFGTFAPTNAGTYAVRATDSKGTKTGTLVIAKAPLYVTPDDQWKFGSQDNPPLTLSYSGWINGDLASLVNTAPTLKTTATRTSVGGVYPITASGGSVLANYGYIYQQGALVVDSFAGSYEALLTRDGGGLVGKLEITVAASNTSFTGKLYCADEKTALPLKGILTYYNPGYQLAGGVATATSNGISYIVTITTRLNGYLTTSITRQGRTYFGGSAYAPSNVGRRLLSLASGKTAPYSGSHTVVLEPATPAASGLPAGAGWATATISTTGVMTLAGRLGDGTVFTTTLKPDDSADPVFRLFLQPYKTGSATRLYSNFGGAFTLLPHPSTSPALAGRRYVESTTLSWVKAGLTADTTYPAGFGNIFNPVSTVMIMDPWLPPAAARGTTPAITLASRLGLMNSSFQILHSNTGSPLNGNLPTRISLSSTNLVSVVTPSANTTKWKTTLLPTTGLFSGSFELADVPLKPRAVTFTGVLRQPATAADTLIGDGHYLLPPLTGSEKTTGEVMFLRP